MQFVKSTNIFVLVNIALLSVLSMKVNATDNVLQLDVKEHVLQNGLKLLILEKHDVPVVSLRIIYKVGSVNEHTGITGVSHLFEHMMFKGTKIFGTKNYEKEKPLLEREDDLIEKLIPLRKNKDKKGVKEEIEKIQNELIAVRDELKRLSISGEIWSIYPQYGAIGLNASTSKDTTTYYCNLPANKLELWAFIEADRMKNRVLREFYSERDVVMEERRLRNENSPSGLMWEQLAATAFTAHPYKWPIIGWMSDIENVTRKETSEYFKKYYGPNNAVIIIVGDVNTENTIKLIEKYFGDIASQPDPPKVKTIEPKQKGEKRVYVEYDANPQLAVAYHIPAIGHPDQYVLDVIESLITRGRTSRLYKGLIDEKRIAVSANAYSGPSKYPGVFLIFLKPRHPHTVNDIENVLYEEIERLKSEPVSDWELQKIKNQIEADFIRSMQSISGLASRIAHYESIYNWKYINSYVEKTLAVSKDDIIRVAKKYFTRKNRTVAILEKKKKI